VSGEPGKESPFQARMSPVLQRARDWLNIVSPRESGWAVVRDLVAENDRLTLVLEEIASFPISGYHAGASQKIALRALEGSWGEPYERAVTDRG
jgi:hypothetical protein